MIISLRIVHERFKEVHNTVKIRSMKNYSSENFLMELNKIKTGFKLLT